MKNKFSQLITHTKVESFYYLNYFSKVIEYQGVRLSVKEDCISKSMFYQLHHRYEQDEIILINKYVSSEDSILEVGGGIGFLSLYCKKHKQTRDYCIVESNPQLISTIEKNFHLNKFEMPLLINKVIVGRSEHKNVNFFITKNFWSSSSIPRHSDAQMISLEGITLPALLSELAFRPTVLIMDIEGGEQDIPVEALTQFKKVIIELHPYIIGTTTVSSIISNFIKNGFTLRDFKKGSYYFERSACETNSI